MDATAELVLSFYGERWVLTVAETYGELPSKKKGVLLLGSHKKNKCPLSCYFIHILYLSIYLLLLLNRFSHVQLCAIP